MNSNFKHIAAPWNYGLIVNNLPQASCKKWMLLFHYLTHTSLQLTDIVINAPRYTMKSLLMMGKYLKMTLARRQGRDVSHRIKAASAFMSKSSLL